MNAAGTDGRLNPSVFQPAGLDRRRFLVMAVALAAGPALGVAPRRRHAARHPSPWLTIRADDTALLEVPFTELGQGTLLGITQLIAEELDLPPGAFTTHSAMAPSPGGAGLGPPMAAWDVLRKAAAR